MRRRPLLALAAVLALAVPASAAAQTTSYQRGPTPSLASVQATTGPFATARTSVSDAASTGFGSGTISYPTDTSQGTFGAVAVAPGYTASESSIAWLGPRLASQGFVVLTFNTNSRYDQPATRGDELLAALDYLTQRSSVRTRIDPSRTAVMGHSMGGGGTLEAAKDRPSLQAAVALTPWDLDKTWPEVATPTLLIGAQSDSVAPPAQHAIPFYSSLPSALPKSYLELAGASHFAPNSPNTTLAATSISWLKRFVDDDVRYSQFVCPSATAATSRSVSQYRTTCTG